MKPRHLPLGTVLRGHTAISEDHWDWANPHDEDKHGDPPTALPGTMADFSAPRSGSEWQSGQRGTEKGAAPTYDVKTMDIKDAA